MRIVAGEFGGRVIESPSAKTTRPTTDRVRESIFSSVYSRIGELDGTCALDAFAGSGALGIEALSRGARSCFFIEQDRNAREVLKKNLSSLGIPAEKARVLDADAFAVAGHANRYSLPAFGLVLLDPPYAYEPSAIHAMLEELASQEMLSEGCAVVYEHALSNRQSVADEFEGSDVFAVTGQKKYGKIGVTYLSFS